MISVQFLPEPITKYLVGARAQANGEKKIERAPCDDETRGKLFKALHYISFCLNPSTQTNNSAKFIQT